MGEIANQISAKRTEISLLQASIITLQRVCKHRMVFSSQKLVDSGLGTDYVATLACEECGVEKQEVAPYCDVHKIKMDLATDEESKQIEIVEQQKPDNLYYLIHVHRCPQCNERKVTKDWDK